MADTIYKTEAEVLDAAERVLERSLRAFIPESDMPEIESNLIKYSNNRKGYLGDLIEQYVFNIKNNSRAESDFKIAGIELKTTPLKVHAKKRFVSKERLVFSMINYEEIIHETWETSSFLEKNKLLLILFYLYSKDESLLDYEFKFVYLLNLLEDISEQDIDQIRSDWEAIVAKIRRKEAHLLSEADTYYLGACTKAKNSQVTRTQAGGLGIPAKPRAFSLKQSYLNYIIQKDLLENDTQTESIYKDESSEQTIEEVVQDKFKGYIGLTGEQILKKLKWQPDANSKNQKRLIVNRILTGTGSNKIEEFEKANITLRAVALEPNGKLRESISFPAFDYKDLITQEWYDEETGEMSAFHAQLETQKFLFIIFQKIAGTKDVVLRGFKFWNFPAQDMGEAERVFKLAQERIREGDYKKLPKTSESPVAHVRPHDVKGKSIETPQHTQEKRRCFWLNAKYIERFLKD